MTSEFPKLHAVIGVWFRNGLTYYVKRSEKMTNYPSVWSLLSIQFDPRELPDPTDLSKIQPLMEKMSAERLGGAPIETKSFLTSGNSDHNSFGKDVHLHLYEIEFKKEPKLNPDYYTKSAWLTAEEYERRSAGKPCGLCLRLWSDYAWMAGLTSRPFVAREAAQHG